VSTTPCSSHISLAGAPSIDPTASCLLRLAVSPSFSLAPLPSRSTLGSLLLQQTVLKHPHPDTISTRHIQRESCPSRPSLSRLVSNDPGNNHPHQTLRPSSQSRSDSDIDNHCYSILCSVLRTYQKYTPQNIHPKYTLHTSNDKVRQPLPSLPRRTRAIADTGTPYSVRRHSLLVCIYPSPAAVLPSSSETPGNTAPVTEHCTPYKAPHSFHRCTYSPERHLA
jgi:hypothetical protein